MEKGGRTSSEKISEDSMCTTAVSNDGTSRLNPSGQKYGNTFQTPKIEVRRINWLMRAMPMAFAKSDFEMTMPSWIL
jgi:hypothetical protein